MKTEKKNEKGNSGLVFCISPLQYKLFDKRSARPVYYTDISNNDANKPGMVIQEIDDIKFNGSNSLTYFIPNNVGILLSIAQKSTNSAKEIFEKELNPNRYNHSLNKTDNNKKDHVIEKSVIIYDFIELIQTSIVFSYTALEAFVNLSIPEDYKYNQLISNKGITEVYDKSAIERWIPLKTKLSEILVDIYQTENLSKKPIWSSLVKLEEYRHDIIHQKSINRVEFYKKYFNSDIFKICLSGEEIISFFYKHYKDKNYTNPLWPWLINKEYDFPVKQFESKNFEVIGNLYEHR
jgi:hypothetical protein